MRGRGGGGGQEQDEALSHFLGTLPALPIIRSRLSVGGIHGLWILLRKSLFHPTSLEVRAAAASATVRLYDLGEPSESSRLGWHTSPRHGWRESEHRSRPERDDVTTAVAKSVLDTLKWLIPDKKTRADNDHNCCGHGGTNYHNWRERLFQNAQHRRSNMYRNNDLANPKEFPYTIALRRRLGIRWPGGASGVRFEDPPPRSAKEEAFIYLKYVLWGCFVYGSFFCWGRGHLLVLFLNCGGCLLVVVVLWIV